MNTTPCNHSSFTDKHKFVKEIEREVNRANGREILQSFPCMISFFATIASYLLHSFTEISSAGNKTQTALKYTLITGVVFGGLALGASLIPQAKLLSEDDVECETCKSLTPLKNKITLTDRKMACVMLTINTIYYAGMGVSSYFPKDQVNLIPTVALLAGVIIGAIAFAPKNSHSQIEKKITEKIQQIADKKFPETKGSA